MIFYIFTIVAIMMTVANCKKYILVHPQRQSVTLNSTITLQCRVVPIKNIKVQWVKNGFGLGDTRTDIRQYGQAGTIYRYDLPLDIEKGQYDLQITNVNLNDEGEYYCQTSVNNQAITSNRASVQVYVSSRAPKIIQITNEGNGEEIERFEGSPIIVDNGHLMVLRCQADAGRPGAKLTWSIDNDIIKADASGNFNEVMLGSLNVGYKKEKPEAKLRDSFSILRAKVNQLLNGKAIQCSAINKGYEKFNLPVAKAKIEIYVAPTVSMDILPRRINNEFVENEWITVSCLASGRPNQFTWKWYVNGNKLENESHNVYKAQTGRTMNAARIKCIANNNKDGEAQQIINVKYGPQFLMTSPSVYPSIIGDNVKMSCEAESNPKASIYWQRESSNEIIGHGSTLYRRNVQEVDFGIYVCTATAEGFTPTFKKTFLAQKRRPFVSENADRSAVVGKPALLRCIIQSVPEPRPSEILWFYRGRRIMESNKYNVFQEKFLGGTTSNLQINSVEASDFGHYNCSVTTSMGSHSRTLLLSKNSQMPLILIVGGTIFVTMAMLVIIIIICICKRGICNNKYQKGSPVNRKGHSEEPLKNCHAEMDYQCQPNIYHWMPPNQRDPAKSSFVRYGQDVDDRSSIRNGSITQYRGLDMCSTYTSSIPGSQNGEKLMRCPDEEEMYPSVNQGMLCSMHVTQTGPLVATRTSPCNMHPFPQPQMQHQISLPKYNFTSFPNPPYLANYISCANTNFALPSYPVHSPSSEPGTNGSGTGSVVPSTLPPLDPSDPKYMVEMGPTMQSPFLNQGAPNSHYINSYLSPVMKAKQPAYNSNLPLGNDNNSFRNRTLDRRGLAVGFSGPDQSTNI